MYPRPRVLITYCRKRKNSISLSTSVPDIMEDVAIQESKTKSTNIDISLLDESTEFIGLAFL
uniref:Putative ovule protein n=1 Tax=Solanum chacoense TaxID=4108 RepID=A0A0V0GLY7_SOLCH